ncbi:TPA: hypothetical protein DCW54_02330 [Candidatus Dependentiae bacterium]|nr:hypothetical protein [Candidatus Dependentiae bacterium]
MKQFVNISISFIVVFLMMGQAILCASDNKNHSEPTITFTTTTIMRKRINMPLKNQILHIFQQEKNAQGLFNLDLYHGYEGFLKRFSFFKDVFFEFKEDLALLQIEEKIIGVLFFSKDNKTQELTISWVAIDEQFHNQGYGKKLLTKTLSQYADYQANLDCYKHNEQACTFYKKNGFQITKTTDKCYHFSKQI